MKEHVRKVKTCANGSNIAKLAWLFGHRLDLNHSRVIDKGSFRVRKTLEAWHTTATKHADINSKSIPNQYSIHPLKNIATLSILVLSCFLTNFSRLFCIHFTNIHFMFHPWKAVDRGLKAYVSFSRLLTRERFYCIL